MADENQTIIIKKIKKGGGGHHGGAWKVAYADFVTAMMAFFLLLWLLSSTSESQKAGIAEYFTPTIGLKDSQGIGFDGGESSTTEEGAAKNDSSQINIIAGQPESGPVSNVDESPVDGEEESQMFEEAAKEIEKAIEEEEALNQLAENIRMEQTPEGLKIELRDSDKYSMFQSGSAVLSKDGTKLLKALIPIIRKLPNHLSVSGHTDATPYSGKDKKYSNWELSSDRALSARRFLEKSKMTTERVKKVVGFSSSQPALPDDPAAKENRRIDIILLRGSHMSLLPQEEVAPHSLLTTPNAQDTLKKRKKKIENKEKENQGPEEEIKNHADPISLDTYVDMGNQDTPEQEPLPEQKPLPEQEPLVKTKTPEETKPVDN